MVEPTFIVNNRVDIQQDSTPVLDLHILFT